MGIGMQGMQDDSFDHLSGVFSVSGKNQKRQFHVLVETAGNMDGTG